MGMGRLSRGRV
jgi:hypothetical protein